MPRTVADPAPYVNIYLLGATPRDSILVPACIHCALRWREGWSRMAGALLAFAVAIAARVLDSGLGAKLLPMGTHFLWHVFGGISAFCLISYIFGAAEAIARKTASAPGNTQAVC